MPRVLLVVGLLALLMGVGSTTAAEKPQPRVVRIADSVDRGELRPQPLLSSADTCIVRHDDGIYYKIDGWVTGNELYKSYCDPSLTCPGAYPFTVTEINMPMYFAGTPTFTVSVDVEAVDNTDPACPVPGALMAISSDWELSVPSAGLYDIWIPLDTPIVVTGPFFAGFYLGTAFDPTDSAAIVIDTIPVPCRSYNAWDTTIGFIDLAQNQYYNFPGRLVLYASGVPGGAVAPPSVELIFPGEDDTCYASTPIWLRDRNNSPALGYAVFEYRPATGGTYVEVGRDYTPETPLRNGSTPASTGDGLSYVFDFSGLAEGRYTVRATVYDTLGAFDSDSVTIYVEPTPPVPQVISYSNGGSFCSPLALAMVCPDENLDFVQAFRKSAEINYSALVSIAGPPAGGLDYVGPMAVALALQLWYNRGYTAPMTAGSSPMTIADATTLLASWFKTTEYGGTYDEDLFIGLTDYLRSRGNQLRVRYQRNPSYFDIRDWTENLEYAVLLAVSGSPGTWFTVDGFSDLAQPDGSYYVAVINPITGTRDLLLVRSNAGVNEINFNGTWHPIDMMVGVYAPDWMVTRTSIGADFVPADGLTINWNPTGVIEGDPYFFYVKGSDQKSMKGATTLLLQYRCNQTYTKGDFNNDTTVDVADASYLLSYIAQRGPVPIGGAGRADANCDGYVNIADVVYFLNYLLGGASVPCY